MNTFAHKKLKTTQQTNYPIDICDFSYPIQTESSEAQLWFNRGLLQCINFNHYEGTVCFENVIKIDPTCAMAHWGIAYSLSVNYNKVAYLTTEEYIQANKASIEAERLAGLGSNEGEKALCTALKTRYDETPFEEFSTDQYAKLNQSYVNSMKQVYEKALNTPSMKSDTRFPDGSYPFHSTAAFLYAEALMQMKPWALWKTDELEETLKAKAVLESFLPLFPNHPALCHLYVHLMEMSPTPESAIPQSDMLRTYSLDCGHLLHMASHIDMQVGRYQDAVECNQQGIVADLKFCELRGYDTNYQGYLCHNYHMLVWACLYDGRYATALEAAEGILEKTPLTMLDTYGHLLEPYFNGKWHVWIRFGKWEEILNEPLPTDKVFIVCIATAYYAKGMAFAALGNVSEAENMQKLFLESLVAEGMEERLQHNVKSIDSLRIAEQMLQGEIMFRKWVVSDKQTDKQLNEAMTCLRRAVMLDDALPYDEPWGWMVPTRHALAALLVEAHGFGCSQLLNTGVTNLDEAEAVYRQDLKMHPNNVWSLRGLANCLTKMSELVECKDRQGRYQVEIAQLHEQAVKAGERADIPIGASCLCALAQQGAFEALSPRCCNSDKNASDE